MFKVRIPSQETYKIHTRPVIFQSLATVLEYFQIHQKHKIFFNGEAEVSKLIGGFYNSKSRDDVDTDVGYDDKIFIELEEDEAGFNDELDSEQMGGQTTPLMWEDPLTKSSIRPVFSGRRYRITINKFFKDRVTAKTFRNGIRSALLNAHVNTLFDADVHYPIPASVLLCYQDVYKRLVNAGKVVDDNGHNFLTWFRSCSQVPTDIISNIAGQNDCLVFLQPSVENGIDYDQVNLAQVVKGQYIGQFEVSWTYSFHWNEHVKWEIEYPIQVYQQVMKEEWLPDVPVQNVYEPAPRRFMESSFGRAIFGNNKPIAPFYHVLPRQDNWRSPVISWLNPQLQILVSMEDVDEQVVINIKDIHGFTWDDRFLFYIMKYHNKVTTRHRNPMSFKLFSDNTEVLEGQYELRSNGDLVLLRKPTMGAIYRLVFSIDYALRLYDDDCIHDLITDPDYGKWIIGVIFPFYPLPPDWGSGGLPDWWDVNNDIEVGDGEEIDRFFNMMAGSIIIAKREGQPTNGANHNWGNSGY